MSLKWTILATVAVLALAVGGMVLFEVTGYRSSAQRQAAGNTAFVAAGIASGGLWGWHLARRRKPRR